MDGERDKALRILLLFSETALFVASVNYKKRSDEVVIFAFTTLVVTLKSVPRLLLVVTNQDFQSIPSCLVEV